MKNPIYEQILDEQEQFEKKQKEMLKISGNKRTNRN